MEHFIFGLKIFAGAVGLIAAGYFLYAAYCIVKIGGWLPRLGAEMWRLPGKLAQKAWANACPADRLPSGEMPPRLRLVVKNDSPVGFPDGKGTGVVGAYRSRDRRHVGRWRRPDKAG